MTSFYTEDELRSLELKHFGKNVLISRNCSIYHLLTICMMGDCKFFERDVL